MSSFKKILRILYLAMFIILASVGMGFGFNIRERYLHKENTIEVVEKRDDEESEEKEIKE